MEQLINYLIEHWGRVSAIGFGILCAILRLTPTEKNYDILKTLFKLLDMIIPNIKKERPSEVSARKLNGDNSLFKTHVLIILLSISFTGWSQTNGFFKGINSYNASDTSFQQNNRNALQNLYGNAGNFYFDKTRNKWRIWAGACPSCSTDSAYVDLLNPGSGGGGSQLFFKNGLTKQADSITVKLGGTITGNTTISIAPTNKTFNIASQNFDAFFALNGGTGSNASVGLFTGIATINLDNTNQQITIEGYQPLSFKGVVYTSDYSPNYTIRSLIDKNYGDTHLNGLTFTNSPSTSNNIIQYNGTNFTYVDLNVESGKYTPTITNGGNTSSITSFPSNWSRVGTIVTVSGMVQFTITTISTNTILVIPLPVASNFTLSSDGHGTANWSGTTYISAMAFSDASTDTVNLQFISNQTGEINAMRYIFTYEIK